MKCLIVKRTFFAELGDLSADVVSVAFKILCAKTDQMTDEGHIIFFEASGGSGRRTYADTAGNEGALRIVGMAFLLTVI